MGWGREMPVTHGGLDADDDENFARIKEMATMALSDGLRSVEEIERMEEIIARSLDEHARLIREDEAACSEERALMLDDGTLWEYVTVHDEYVRIIGCKTDVESLEVPAVIEDKPVAELAIDACSYLDSVREIICSPQIERIGNCAFRSCGNLERLVLPRNVDTYDSSWVRGCRELAELVLPGMLTRVTSSIFDEGRLRTLVIGFGTYDFAPGLFAQGTLEHIDIDDENPFITTDGQAIFAHEGTHLRVLALACERYVIPDGCQVIEKKAFANRAELYRVDLPDTVTTIEDYAFSYSGLESFVSPRDLRVIGERAFFRCRRLTRVVLDEGLISIGDDAFTGTGIETLRVPATLGSLGDNVADDTKVTFCGDDAGFSIAPGGILEIDREGGLYRNGDDGKRFVRLLDDEATRYVVRSGTVEIEPHAFMQHAHIREVVLPEGLRRIGDAAFRDCHELAIADFPSTLEEVGDEAFLDTSLSRAFIPRNLRHLGNTALVTHGAHNGDVAPSLTSIGADEENERFYSVPGLLIERHDEGGSHVVVYADGVESVRIPDDVSSIDPYAFGGARHLRELFLSDRIRHVGMRGLSLDCFVEHFHVDLDEPHEGHASFDFYFPDAPRSAHEIQLAFNLSSSVDLTRIFKHYDSAIVNMHEFDKKTSDARDDFDVYGQAKLAIERLADPVLMSSTNKIMLTQVLTKNLEEACEAIARHDDREAIDELLELEILNKDNLLGVIDHIGKLQDAAMTGYLLEIKRRLFQHSAVDFDL